MAYWPPLRPAIPPGALTVACVNALTAALYSPRSISSLPQSNIFSYSSILLFCWPTGRLSPATSSSSRAPKALTFVCCTARALSARSRSWVSAAAAATSSSSCLSVCRISTLAFINAGIKRRTFAGAKGAGSVYVSSAADMRAADCMTRERTSRRYDAMRAA